MEAKQLTENNNDKTLSVKNETLKDFPYPSCWQDDARMQVMLSTFRGRDTSPDSFDSKMKFWEDIIAQYCLHIGKPFFCKRELQNNFTRGERLPACLDSVISHMQQSKQIRLRSEYEYDPENSWSGWAINSFVKRPLTWGWQNFKKSVFTEDRNKESLVEWVHLQVMKEHCSELERKVLQHNRGKLMHYDDFKSICSNLVTVHDDAFFILLQTLNCQKLVGLEYRQDKSIRVIHLIKIPKPNSDVKITESDKAIHNLQITKSTLINEIENLEDQIKENEKKASQYVKEKKRQLAKTYLRKKILLEKNHEKRSLALHNIEALLSNVDEAQHNGVIIDAYKIGSKALQTALNESGLTYDNVDEVLADVRVNVEQHNEIQDTISNAKLVDSMDYNMSEDELERELRELVGEGEVKEEMNKNSVSNDIDQKLAYNINKTRQITITDDDLLDMLNDLEVEEGTLPLNNESKTITN